MKNNGKENESTVKGTGSPSSGNEIWISPFLATLDELGGSILLNVYKHLTI